MLEKLFRVDKPVIAMLQLRPLPGSPRYEGEPLRTIIDAALAEANTLAETGFDGLQLQNMGDNPGTRRVGPETIAYMSAAALAVGQAFPELSLSVLVNWDAEASIAVADASDADFVRIEHTFTGVSVTSWGLSEACCYDATRFRARVGARVPIFADVFEPHAVPLAPLPAEQAARAAVHEGGADGLYVTGANFAQSAEWLRVIRKALRSVLLFLGGGVTAQNVAEAMEISDAVTVATSIKGGDMRNAVDPQLARDFMRAVRQVRDLRPHDETRTGSES